MLQQGVPVSDVLYYYGDQGYNFVLPKQMDPPGYDYDVVNAEVLMRNLAVKEGRLALPHGVSYRLLVLPDREDIDLDVLRKVETLVRDGATVVGRKPSRSTGYSGYPDRDAEVKTIAARMWTGCDVRYGKGRIVCGPSIRELLPPPDFRFESTTAQLDFIHRSAPGAEIYFVHNKNKRAEDVVAEFRVKNRQPELWDPSTSAITPVKRFEETANGTRFRLHFDPEGSTLVVFRREGRPETEAEPRITERAGVAGPWSLRFVDGPGAPAPVELGALRSWTESTNANERFFSGIGVYETEIEVPVNWIGNGRRVYLDLGELWAVAGVTVNGRDLGVVWKRPFRADITAAAKAGRNRISIRVANNWVNRLVGDAQSTGPKHTKTNVLTTGVNAGAPWEDVPLRASGLFGPVRLELETRQTP
jgi:hypothetical protein